jgi:Na+-driven multidrug efflux pump
MAFAAALGSISAQNLGAGKTDRALQSAKLGVLFSLVFTVPAVLIATIMPTAIVSLFSPDPDVIRAAAQFLVPFSWDFILISFVFCINSFFNSCGMTKFVAVHETIAALVIRVPVSWLLSRIPGATLFHVGIGTPAATLVSLILCLIFFRLKLSGGKLALLNKVTQDG